MIFEEGVLEYIYKVQAPAHSEVQDLAHLGRELGRCKTDRSELEFEVLG